MLSDLLKEKIMLETSYWNTNLVYKGEINCLGFSLLEINYEYTCTWMLIYWKLANDSAYRDSVFLSKSISAVNFKARSPSELAVEDFKWSFFHWNSPEQFQI